MKQMLLLLTLLGCFTLPDLAQNTDAGRLARQANNPLASIKSLSVHNIYTPSIFGSEGTLNTTWLRYAQPFGRLLVRASMPVNTVSTGTANRSGLGDFNVFGAFLLTDPTAPKQFGIGPILTIPTAASSLLGAGKWQTGIAIAAYMAGNEVFQSGMLATWQHSFAGRDSRNKVQIATIQPFFMWQLGKGLYLRSSGTNLLDFENGNYLVPIGAGIGRIIKAGKMVFNIFAEPQFTVWYKGDVLPETQVFIGFNTQF